MEQERRETPNIGSPMGLEEVGRNSQKFLSERLSNSARQGKPVKRPEAENSTVGFRNPTVT